MIPLKQRLIDYYKLDKEALLSLGKEPSFSSIPLIDQNDVVKSAVNRIKELALGSKKILIYGDYDCDGIIATSIIHYSLLKLRKSSSFFIPSRYKDGYGLSLETAKKIVDAGYSLVILVDNGITAHEPITYLKEHDVETLIIDHHELPSTLPPASYIIHPEIIGYPMKEISAGFLSFLFSVSLLNEKDDYLLTLGAISTISDMMPMKGINQIAVSLALRAIKKNHYQSINLLCPKNRIDEKNLSLEVVPLLNAVGRIDEGHKASRLVHFLSLTDPKMPETASFMKEANLIRKNLTKGCFNEIKPDLSNPGILVKTSLKEGLNGLLANKLMMEYGKMALALSPSSVEKGCLVGSLRSKGDCSVTLFQEQNKDLLVHYGGHKHAGGITLLEEKLPLLEKRFFEFAKEHPIIDDVTPLIELGLDECNLESFRVIRSFGPFGIEHPEPTFIIKDINTKNLRYSKNCYLRHTLDNGTTLVSFINSEKDFTSKEKVNLKATFTWNEWNGRSNVEIIVTII